MARNRPGCRQGLCGNHRHRKFSGERRHQNRYPTLRNKKLKIKITALGYTIHRKHFCNKNGHKRFPNHYQLTPFAIPKHLVRITVLMRVIFYWPPFISVKDFGVKTVLQFTSRIKYLLVEWQSVHTRSLLRNRAIADAKVKKITL